MNRELKIKNYELRILTLVAIAVLLFVSAVPFDIEAQGGLVPCGTSTTPPCQPCHIFSLIQNIFNFIWKFLALPLAILMFAYGGFLMIVPGIGGEKSVPMYQKGKKVLTNTIIGILIIFLAWLTIDTIIKALAGQLGSSSPALIPARVGFSPGNLGPWNKIECKFTPAAATPQSYATPGQGETQVTGSFFNAGETNNRNTFTKLDIEVNKPPCPIGKSFGEVQGGCTNVGGLPELAVLRLTSIKNNCGGTMKITGGSELGHTSHCDGCAVVDIAFDPTIASCIRKNPSAFGIKKICASAEDAVFSHNCSTKEKFRHLHMEFS